MAGEDAALNNVNDLHSHRMHTSGSEVYEVRDHFLYRNGYQVPFVPHDKRDGRSKIDPKFFVYHYHAGRFGLDGLVSHMKKSSTRADVHLCMDREGNIVQMAPFNEKCWHAGTSSYGGYTGLNSHSIGIEVINPGALEIVESGKLYNGS